jgi:hypothetical protein
MIKKINGLGLIAALVYFAAPVSATAETVDDTPVEQPAQDQSAGIKADHSLATAAGRTAYIDPKTGQLSSQAGVPIENQAALQAQVNLPPVKITTYANGTVGAALNGRFRVPLTATIACDGQIKTKHSNEVTPQTEKCEVVK